MKQSKLQRAQKERKQGFPLCLVHLPQAPFCFEYSCKTSFCRPQTKAETSVSIGGFPPFSAHTVPSVRVRQATSNEALHNQRTAGTPRKSNFRVPVPASPACIRLGTEPHEGSLCRLPAASSSPAQTHSTVLLPSAYPGMHRECCPAASHPSHRSHRDMRYRPPQSPDSLRNAQRMRRKPRLCPWPDVHNHQTDGYSYIDHAASHRTSSQRACIKTVRNPAVSVSNPGFRAAPAMDPGRE